MSQQANYSGTRDPRIECVELTDGTTTLRYVLNWSNLTLGSNDYTALDMDVDSLSEPSQTTDGVEQELTISMDNVDGQLAVFAHNVNRNKINSTLTRRSFYLSDTSTPAAEYSMRIKSASYTVEAVQFTCGYMPLLSLAFPRNTYGLNDFPGIRYIG